MESKLITDSAVEVLPSGALKSHMRIEHSEEDSYIDSLAKVARQWAEKFTRRAFITQVWEIALSAREVMNLGTAYGSAFSSAAARLPVTSRVYTAAVELPIGPLISIESFKYYQTDNTVQTYPSNMYYVDTWSMPGRLVLNFGNTWPTSLRDEVAAVIQWKAGYGLKASDVPSPIKQGILVIGAALYENRELAEVPAAAQSLLGPYRTLRV